MVSDVLRRKKRLTSWRSVLESGDRLRVCRSAALPFSITSGEPVSLEMRCGV